MSRWFPGRRVSFGGAEYLLYPVSSWLVVLLWVSAPDCLCFVALVVSISCCQCWLYKNFQRLALFVGHLKNSGAEVGYKSHRWELGIDMIGRKIENWDLLSWYWSVNSANDERFGHSQLGAHPLYSGFFAETSTKHLQLHLLCPGGSWFENGIGRAPGPSGLVWSSDSSYPWSDEGCCGLWGQAPCACNLPNSDAMSWRL